MSDSQRKLERLLLPGDLAGKRVLDIGCNEGFFCHELAKRGALEIIGIDEHESPLAIAQKLYSAPNICFLQQRWDVLPDGPFDLVLWTSAMHYEADPADVIRRVVRVLAPDGLFVLECGVLDRPTKELVLAGRHSDSRWYPTLPLLEEMLEDYSVRRVGPPELTEGDSVPRSVFHCRPRMPIVMLIRGATQVGKSTLAATLREAATKVVSLDAFVTRIAMAQYHHTPIQRMLRDAYDPKNLGKIYHGIDDTGLTAEYARLLVEGIAHSDRLIVIEGLITEAQAAALAAQLEGRAFVWDVVNRRRLSDSSTAAEV
jgi:Methyltransferase domain